ncbi:hypothetical protein B0J15DRAFT_466854 [Fusarium solani]|uniref:Uncharacterized protein n=1 Tax=Fusarium solani TaxID=169388 RepID=A0A9P9H947_FUSSL|nr:uncharacterized protein B0J15DRAFT_466854 [Fusarium solani]KAH7253011.1 hypothetical protein B0J15DRAFT_466854 [Fusarium solani]
MRKLKVASHDHDKFHLGQFRFKLARLSFPAYDMQLGTYQGTGIGAATWCHLDSEIPSMSELQSTGLIDNTGAHPATLCISRTQFWDDWFMKIVASHPLNLVFRLGSPFSVGHELAKAVDAEPWWSSRRDRMIPPEFRREESIAHELLQGPSIQYTGAENVVTFGSHFTRRGAWPYIDYKWNFTFDWEINFTLRAVNDGGLEIIPEIKVNTLTDYDRVRPYQGWKQCIDNMTEHVKRVLENLKKAIFNDLDEGLKNQQTMHVPAKSSTDLASLSNEDDIWEPDLSAVAHLPARQQPYVHDDSVPAIFHASAIEILSLGLDEEVAEAQRKGGQEAIQAGGSLRPIRRTPSQRCSESCALVQVREN